MVLLFGYDEERCKTADNIQPEQALPEQFPVFAHCLVLRLHRFQLRRTVIQLSACLSRYEEQQQGASRCGGNDQPQPETVTPFPQRTQPEIPFPTSRTGVCPPPSADNPHEPQQQDSRHDQVAVPRMRGRPSINSLILSNHSIAITEKAKFIPYGRTVIPQSKNSEKSNHSKSFTAKFFSVWKKYVLFAPV